MIVASRLAFRSLCFALLLSTAARAQEAQKPRPQTAGAPVTVSASGTRVRFAAVGPVERMRLEVFDAAGESVFDTGLVPGNLRDWRLVNARGQRLTDGSYLCVVTVRELTGRLTFKQGSILISGGQASLALDGTGRPEQVEPDAALSARTDSEPAAMTIVAHDGTDGQVTSTGGALTFRTGDVLAGKEREQMRVTPDGRVGIGTTAPRSTLDVAGTIRASKGIVFPDGTIQTTGTSGRVDSEGNVTPNAAGAGTQGQLAKWTDNAGTLGDSVVTELNGNIGVGTTAPNSKLHVEGALEIGAASGAGANPTLSNPNNLAGFSQMIFYPASGTNTNMSFTVIPRGTGQANNRAQFSILNTDRVADPNNVEFASFRARGTDFVFGTGKTGTGLNRPIMLAAGFLSNNTTNNGQLFLATNGNVGVGTTNPQGALQIGPGLDQAFKLDPSNGSPNAGFIRFGDKTGWKLHITRSREGSAGPLNTGATGAIMTIQDNGRIGIGTTTPTATLQVNGHIDTNTLAVYNGFVVVLDGQDSQASPTCISNANYRMGYCSSSLRYKIGVTSFTGGLDIIGRLRPVSFTWKGDGAHDIGLAAEEVAKVEPLLAFRNGRGEIEGVRYNQLSAVFINAFKEQQRQIEQLRAELSQLRRAVRHGRRSRRGR
jgi:hypothetical protein